MVNGYTVNAIGDSFIVPKGPYNNIVRFSDWNILAGVKRPNETVGVINTTADSNLITGVGTFFSRFFNDGDVIIFNGTSYVIAEVVKHTNITLTTNVESTLNSIEFYSTLGPNTTLSYEFRWSEDNFVFSEYSELNELDTPGSLLHITLNSKSTIYLEIRITCTDIDSGDEITVLDVTVNTTSGVTTHPHDCDTPVCDDPFSTTDGAVISVTANSNTFNPYAATKAVNLYKQLNNMVSDMFGHSVNYFRTEPDKRTSDVTLMEYSLHNVVANNNVKILVPDNEFPEEASTFDIFGMEFAEFEVHIVHDAFKNVFGDSVRPRSKDYMFIPLINKMYEISSVSIADEFNASRSYWRIKLVKYQDRSSVIKGDFEIETDSLITGIEEVFGEEIRDEQEKVTKPIQYKTVSNVVKDGVRTYVDPKLKIVDGAVINEFATVSKNHYDLSSVLLDSVALKYSSKSEIKAGESLSVTAWFKPKFSASDTGTYTILSDGHVDGFRLKINSTDVISNVNNTTHTFNHDVIFSDTKWYAIVFNVNNTFHQVTSTIYELSNGTNGGNVLSEAYNGVKLIDNVVEWSYAEEFNLVGGKLNLTNIRVFNKPLEKAEHMNVLNQYVVRDNQHSLVIDNAIPSLGYQKFKNAR